MFPAYLNQDLIETIEEWFDAREVVDDDMFDIYLTRVLNRDYGRYMELLRIEPGYARYDWLVNRYNEWRTWGTDNTATGNDNTKTYGMNLERKHGTSETAETLTSGGDYHEHTEYGGSDTNTINDRTRETSGSTTPNAGSTVVTDSKAVDKSNPYSESYENAVAGVIPALDWKTSSSQGQTQQTQVTTYDGGSDETHQTEIESGGDTTSYGSTRDTYATGSKTHTTITGRTGSDNDIYSGQDVTKDEGKTDFDTDRYHMETGRTGDVALLLKDAKEYIQGSSAWSWLSHRLEVCFMGVFEW